MKRKLIITLLALVFLAGCATPLTDPFLAEATQAVQEYLSRRQHLGKAESIRKQKDRRLPTYVVYLKSKDGKLYMPLSAILIDGKWEMRWAIH